ncbi:MAG: DUF4394 domain-containing protein [Acidobacteriota bacterium]
MKKSLGSFIALNRKAVLLLTVALGVTFCGIVSWQAAAQINRRERAPKQGRASMSTDGRASSKISDFKTSRIQADELNPNNEASPVQVIDGVITCPTTITQSTSQTITQGNSFSCNAGAPGFFHYENRYFRAFNAASFGIQPGSPYFVTSVDVGIQSAVAGGASQPMTVNLYANNGSAFPAGTLTLIGTANVDLQDQGLTVLNVPLTATVPAGTLEIVMEVLTPDGTDPGNSIFLGSNAAGQSGPSYIQAAECGLGTPTDLATIGFPNMHLVFNIHGSCTAPTPTPTPVPACATLYAYDFSTDHLISFNAADPATILTDIALPGLDTANDEFLESIDFRPSTGQLYGIATNPTTNLTRVVTINTTTGQVTSVGGTVTPAAGLFFAGDFNPVVDRVREASDADINRRFNPNDGTLAATDTNLAYAAGDPNAGFDPSVVHVAYSNNTPGATQTTLFAIDSNRDVLARIGSVNGSPVSPNSGQLFTVGSLGLNAQSFGGFDIQQGTGIGYAVLRLTGNSQLYKIDLTTGAATLVGHVGPSTNTDAIDGLTVAIAPGAGCSDLSITKTDNSPTYTPGGTTTYSITASNSGADPVVGATVADTFPAAITAVTWTCSGSGGGVCPPAGAGNINASVDLPVGGSVTFTAISTISGAASGSLSNTATITAPAGVTDTAQNNNSATDTDTVNIPPIADLGITKTDGVSTVTAGGTTTYTIVASNPVGPSPVVGATVTDNFPNTITSVNWTCVGAGGGTCPANGTGNISALVNLPVGGSVTFTAVANISSAATFGMSNIATITPPQGITDPNPVNNSAMDVDNICSGTTISYSGPVVPIPDAADLTGTNPGAPANATLNVAGVPGPINDINLSIDGTACTANAGSTTVGLDHTFVNDLRITLISPSNTQVLVINNTDGSGNNLCQVILDDQTANPSIQTVLTAQAPFTGTWKPNAPLSAFNGQNANGTWTLRAQDFFSGDTGNIRAWSLTIGACPTTAAGVSVSGRVTTPDGRGLRNAKVVLTDSIGNARTVTTSSFGFYQFDEVAVGESYVIGVVSKQYRFTSQLIQVGDTLTNMDFVGQE